MTTTTRRRFLARVGAGAVGLFAAVAAAPRAAAVAFYDTVRSQFVNGNLGVGASPYEDDRFKLGLFNALNMVVQVMKTGGDSNDLNLDGAVNVKHAKDYTQTPGYAHTYQVYAEAGMNGVILGNNDYVGLDPTKPYAPTPAAVPDGFIRFELGPLWPYSEKMRLNNAGDLIVGWELVRKHVASQAGTTVTATTGLFDASDVGRFFAWGDYEWRGRDAHADRILEVIDATRVRVETPRSVPAQAGRVCTARAMVRRGALHLADTPEPDVAPGTVAVWVSGGQLRAKTDDGTVTALAGRAPTPTPTHTDAGPVMSR